MTTNIVLFGCGVGESIAVELAPEQWMIVDSTRHPETSQPVALSYLRDIGVSLDQVVRIVISHWHDDHIAGMADLIEACANAVVVIPAAMTSNEFLQLLALYGDPAVLPADSSRGLHEFRAVIEVLKKRKAGGRKPYTLAKSDTLIYREGDREVYCLSPSDESLVFAAGAFSELAQAATKRRLALLSKSPNYIAVALLFRWGQGEEENAILGADLETTPHDGIGWTAALASLSLKGRRAKVFKISHHGSANGHHPQLVDSHCAQKSIGIMTTYNKGISPLPKQSDIERIKSYCDKVYCTTTPKGKVPKRDPVVEKTIREVALSRSLVHRRYGQISVKVGDGQIDCELSGDALLL